MGEGAIALPAEEHCAHSAGEAQGEPGGTEDGDQAGGTEQELPFEMRGTGWRQHLAYHSENLPKYQCLAHVKRGRRRKYDTEAFRLLHINGTRLEVTSFQWD